MLTNNWILLGLFCGFASFAMWAVKYTKIGKSVGATNISLIAGLLLVNLNIVPSWSDIHAIAFSHAVPIGIALLLFQSDIKEVIKLGPKFLIAFFLGTIGIIFGAFIAAFVFDLGPETWKIYGMYAATYIGGSANLAAVGNGLNISKEMYAPINAADVIIFFFWMMFLVTVGKFEWVKSKYVALKSEDLKFDLSDNTLTSNDVLFDAPLALGIAIVVSTIGEYIGPITHIPSILITTTIMIILANTTKIKNITIANELGSWLFMVFFVAIGAIAPIKDVIVAGFTIFFGATTVVIAHGIFSLGLGKIFKIPLEFLLISSSANVGGASTSGPLAAGYNWPKLVAPAVLLGVLGAAIGTYLGFAVAYGLKAIL